MLESRYIYPRYLRTDMTKLGTVLIGYDTESGVVPEASRRPMSIFRRSIEAIMRIHVGLEAPATFFLVGRTLAAGARYLKPLLDYPDLFDFEQHTYSHVLLKTIVVEDRKNSAYARRPTERYVEGGSPQVIRKEVKDANEALKKYLDVTCRGIRGPYGYYRGLSDRPDILEILHEEGIRFTSTYLRNQDDWQPVPIEVQPFWYELQGFPDMLEIPVQGWQDCIWRDINGWTKTRRFEKYLEFSLGGVKMKNRVRGMCFHDWAVIKGDPGAVTMRKFIQYVKERQFKIVSYSEFYRNQRDFPRTRRNIRPSR